MLNRLTLTAASVVALCASTLAGQADTAVEPSVLTCNLSSNTNVVVYSNVKYKCQLKSVGNLVPDGNDQAQIR